MDLVQGFSSLAAAQALGYHEIAEKIQQAGGMLGSSGAAPDGGVRVLGQ